MNIIKNLTNYFNSKAEGNTTEKAPEGICPNCWGKQEYDSVIRELYEDNQIDVNNGKANLNFIQNVVV